MDAQCVYNCDQRAVHQDHVIARALFKRHRNLATLLGFGPDGENLVPSCFDHNIRKGNRRYVPESWADKLELINSLIPGAKHQVWDGGKHLEVIR
jgi:hypothetical protein